MKWIVADPLGGSTMTTTRCPTLLVLPATLWLAVSLSLYAFYTKRHVAM